MTKAKRLATPSGKVPLAIVIGGQVRAWREAANLRQDEVAYAARERGLPWTSATVANVETGRRNLSLEEFIALPFIVASFPLTENSGRWRHLSGFVGDPGRVVVAVRDGYLRCDYLRDLLEGAPVVSGSFTGQFVPADALSYPGAGRQVRERIEAEFDAEIKAARRLKTDELAITAAARRLWGRTLTQEREARVQAQARPDMERRTLQALRGHVTRALIGKLRDELNVSRSRDRRKQR
jgi:hypothetical protein